MSCIEINYEDPDSDVIVISDKEKTDEGPKPVDIRDLPREDLQIVEITEQKEETPPPMPSNEQMKKWRKEIDERIRRKN